MTMRPLILLEAVLLLCGLSVVAIAIPADSHAVAGFGLLVMGLAGASHLWLCLTQRDRYWSLCDLQGASLIASYFIGGAVTLMLSETSLIRRVQITDLATLVPASFFIILLAAILFAFGRLESRMWRRLWPDNESGSWSGMVALALLALALLQAAMIATGKISLQGVQGVENREVPYFVSMVVALSWPLTGLCGWILGKDDLRRRPLFLYTAISLIPVQILFTFAHGRRVILFEIIIFFTCYLWARRKGFTLKQGVIMATVGMPLAYFLWVIFIALRMESYMAPVPPGQDTRTIFARFDSAVTMMDNRWGMVVQGQETEVIDRVYVIGYLVDLMDNSRITNHFNGRLMAYQFVNSIPRVLLPGKQDILKSLKASDTDLTVSFGLGDDDRADSIVTAAYADFRWAGLLIYGIFAFLVSSFMISLCWLLRYPPFTLYVACGVFFFALGTEQNFVTGGMNLIRTLVAVTILAVGYRFVALLVAPGGERRIRV